MAQPSDAEYTPHRRRQTESRGTRSSRRGRPYRFVGPLDGATGRHWRARRGTHANLEGARARARRELLQGSTRVQLSAQWARTDGRLEAHHPDAFADRDRLRHPYISPHFHGRPQARTEPRTLVDGVLRWTMGR